MKRAVLCSFVAILVSGGPGAALLACGDTAGRRVTLEHVAVSEASAFTNSFGWEITLDEATLASGPMYYFEGATEHATRRWLMRRALAHPGHYGAGEARGELTTAATIDLLRRNELPRGRGVTGTIRSARFGFGNGPTIARVVAHARKNGATVSFFATAGLEDVLDPDGHPQVSPCAFRPADVQGDGTITLTIRPSVWLDQLDLAGVTGDLASAPSVYAAYARGLKKNTAYAFAYEAR